MSVFGLLWRIIPVWFWEAKDVVLITFDGTSLSFYLEFLNGWRSMAFLSISISPLLSVSL